MTSQAWERTSDASSWVSQDNFVLVVISGINGWLARGKNKQEKPSNTTKALDYGWLTFIQLRIYTAVHNKPTLVNRLPEVNLRGASTLQRRKSQWADCVTIPLRVKTYIFVWATRWKFIAVQYLHSNNHFGLASHKNVIRLTGIPQSKYTFAHCCGQSWQKNPLVTSTIHLRKCRYNKYKKSGELWASMNPVIPRQQRERAKAHSKYHSIHAPLCW